jgi:AcrR family transcriptional regulator
VAYRPTARTEARKAQTRERIVAAAHELVASGGWVSATVAAVAARAGIATGTVYRYFPSKAELFAEVFRRASQHEVDAMAAAGRDDGRPASERGADAVESFARRALRARRLAYALIAEPVDPAVEAERLVYRRAYRDIVAEIVAAGIASGEFPAQDVEVSSAAVVGAIAEAVIGPVSPTAAERDPEAFIAELVNFCSRSLTREEPIHVRR